MTIRTSTTTIAVSLAMFVAGHDFLRAADSPASNQDWPAFRGAGGMGISSAKNLPVEWNTDKNIAWKVALPGAGASSPVIFGDRIYLTAYSGFFVPGQDGKKDDLKRHLIALKRTDGNCRVLLLGRGSELGIRWEGPSDPLTDPDQKGYLP